MAEENQEVVKQPEVSDGTTQDQVTSQEAEVDVDGVEAKLADLQTQLAKQQEIVDKARKGEKYQKGLRDTEVKKIQSQLDAANARAEALEQKIRNSAADGILRQALDANGVKAVDTALKLVDRNAIKFSEDGSPDAESINAVVALLKASDSVLFNLAEQTTQKETPKAPPAIRATEADKVSGFAAEMAAAKSQAEIKAVLTKYGKS